MRYRSLSNDRMTPRKPAASSKLPSSRSASPWQYMSQLRARLPTGRAIRTWCSISRIPRPWPIYSAGRASSRGFAYPEFFSAPDRMCSYEDRSPHRRPACVANHRKESTMLTLRPHQLAVLLAVTLGAGTGAHAQSAITREQVKAELAEAIRSGNMIGDGTTGQTLRELNPQRYPAIPRVSSTREQVKAELEQARLSGQLSTGGELNIAADQNSANK